MGVGVGAGEALPQKQRGGGEKVLAMLKGGGGGGGTNSFNTKASSFSHTERGGSKKFPIL